MENLKIDSKKWIILLVAIVFLVPTILQAQEEETSEKTWNFTVGPYVLFPTMKGEVGMMGIPVDASASTGDIFSNLSFGTMLYFEAYHPKWTLILDGLYAKLGGEGVTPLLSREASLEMNQMSISLSGMYRLTPWVEVGIGGSVVSVGSGFTIAPGDYFLPGTDFSMTETWFDPLIVTRFMTRFNGSKWRLGLLANVGGFGIGSDFSWLINPFGGYQFGKLFEIDLAWRWYGVKYNKGEGFNEFLYDVTTSGPDIRFLFHF